MIIDKIDFIAYGPFTEKTLDFANLGKLNIIFGFNEAGKSAALRGIRALLYGIEERTADNFIHDNQSLRIGGKISSSKGDTLLFIRRKGRKNTILTPDNNPIDENILKRFLGNTPEELFIRLFGIDHGELLSGGRDILLEQGDAGETLFSAGIGNIRLHEIIEGIKTEAEELFKPRGKKKINQSIEAYKKIKEEISQNALSGSIWIEYKKKLSDIKDSRKQRATTLESLRKEQAHLERIKNSLPLVAKLRSYSQALKDIGDFIELPKDFPDTRIKLINEKQQDTLLLANSLKKIQILKEEIKDIKIPEAIIQNEKTIDDFHQKLGSYLKANRDSKKLQGEVGQLNGDAKKILDELAPGMPIEKAEVIRLGKIKKAKIRNTAKKYSLLSENLRSKEGDLKKLDAEIDELQVKLEKEDKPSDVKKLKATLKAVHAYGNLEEEFRNLVLKSQAEIKKAENSLKRLPLWKGDISELEIIQVPQDKTIDKFDADFVKLSKKMDSLLANIKTVEDRISSVEIELQSIELSGHIPFESDLIKAREHRQTGWELILKDWIEGKRDIEAIKQFAQQKPLHVAYSESVIAADEVADRLWREADRVAKKAHLQAERYKFNLEKNRLYAEKMAMDEQMKSLQTEWKNLWKSADIEPLTPREMVSWLNSYKQLIEQTNKFNEYKIKTDELESRINKSKTDLFDNLNASGHSTNDKTLTLENLKNIAEEYVEKTEEAINKRHLLEDRLANLIKQRADVAKDFSKISEELDALKPEWSEILKTLRLSEGADITIIETYLEKETELFIKIDDASGKLKRIADIEQDAREFSQDIRNFTSKFVPELETQNPEDAVVKLSEMLKKAKEDSARLKELSKQIKQREVECDSLQESLIRNEAELKKLCAIAKCDSIEKLQEIEEKSLKAAELLQKIKESKESLFHYAGAQSLEQFIKDVESRDIDSIDARLINLNDEISSYEKELAVYDTNIGELSNELKGMDGSSRAAQLMENAEGILLSIRKDVERYLKLQVASSILKFEIERYRQRNQSPILRRAGEIFRELTINSFSTIETDYRDDKPVLMCRRHTGELIGVKALSEGTCDQLYLALKLATLEKYLTENEPLPFIVDDILVNFDDRRAQSCLEILVELAKKIQVIFFTHHKHLINIAEEVIPTEKLRVQSL